MKKYILGTLLVGSLAGQGAGAEVRTFDFTASIDRLSSASNSFATSIAGIDAGTTIAVGNLIKGTLSFDDQGTSFGGGTSFVGWNDAVKFTYTFEGVGTRVDASPAVWGYSPNMIGSTDLFNIVGTNAQGVGSNLFLFTPHNGFSWEIGSDTSGSLSVAWNDASNSGLSLNASLNSLVEVTPVPEPSTYAMLLLGAAVLTGVAKRRAARQNA